MNNPLTHICVAAVLSVSTIGTASAAITFDANVTPGVIFGSGNANGGFTVDQNNDIELGLRAKLRHDATGQPQNVFNSNSDGTYSFATGQAVGQSSTTGVWSVEFSINSSFASNSGPDLTNPMISYLLEIDTDPTMGTAFFGFSPFAFTDNAYGDNTTVQGPGNPNAKAAPDSGDFVAQNSQKGVWLIPGYDPNLDATYDFKLTAKDQQGQVLASTQIQVIAGRGGASVPDGGSMMAMFGASLLGLAGFRRFLLKKA